MSRDREQPSPWKRELRHLYGAGILLFYYAKWPILVGWPVMRGVLGYRDNWIIDLIWLWCLGLVLKDIYVLVGRIRKGRRSPDGKEVQNGDHTADEGA